jgi:hypothetical protein
VPNWHVSLNKFSIDSSSTVQIKKIPSVLGPMFWQKTRYYIAESGFTQNESTRFLTLPLIVYLLISTSNGSHWTFDYKLILLLIKPNWLVFDSKLKKENLRITKYGEPKTTRFCIPNLINIPHEKICS